MQVSPKAYQGKHWTDKQQKHKMEFEKGKSSPPPFLPTQKKQQKPDYKLLPQRKTLIKQIQITVHTKTLVHMFVHQY